MAKKRGANGTGTWYYDKKRKLYTYRISAGIDESGEPRRKSFSGKTQETVLESCTNGNAAVPLCRWIPISR